MRTATTRTIQGRVNPDGTIAAAMGGGFTVQKNSTGLYTLGFGGARLLGITYSPYNAANTIFYTQNGGLTDRSAQVNFVAATTSAAQDSAFTFTAVVAA